MSKIIRRTCNLAKVKNTSKILGFANQVIVADVYAFSNGSKIAYDFTAFLKKISESWVEINNSNVSSNSFVDLIKEVTLSRLGVLDALLSSRLKLIMQK